jgi:hypothetical protein
MRLLLAALLALCALAAWPVYANLCAVPARNGSATIAGVVNTYYPGSATAVAGATSFTIGAAAGAGEAIQAGDLLLVIQMQDGTIEDRNNSRYGDNDTTGPAHGVLSANQSGRYEFVRAANAVSALGGTLTLVGGTGGGLTYAYGSAAATPSRGKRSFQVVKVPQYDAATIAGTLAPLPWNGSVGGVVAIDVARRLTFAGGTIDASGRGFRGGGGRQSQTGSGSNSDYMVLSTNGAHGSKGEGIAGTPRFVWDNGAVTDNIVEGLPGGSFARGAPGNAGGGGTDGNPAANDQNSGGGGGANVGDGGYGGNAWCPGGNPAACAASGGHPGAALLAPAVNRIIMGGGGGAGSNNNGTGSPGSGAASSGATGGGIVIVRAAEIAGNGAVRANGADASSTVLNDATGGGGAGGSIVISALRTVAGAAISATADGGDGGTNTGGGSPHGPGGGGGGGYIVTATSVSVSTSVAGGQTGATVNSAMGTDYGATPGSGGSGLAVSTSAIPGMSSGGECTPTVVKSFASSPVAIGAPTRLTIAVTNHNPNTSLTAVNFTDSYPTGLINTATPAAAVSCGGTVTAIANGTSLSATGGSINGGSTCTYSVNTTPTSIGDKTNTIAALAVAGSFGTTVVRNLEAASAVLQVSAPLTVVKASQVYSDPVNGTTNAKAIPGGFLTYTITVANPGSGTVDNDTIVVLDATPANLQLSVVDLISGAGPLVFQQGATPSALTYSWAGLASTTDDLEFSNNGGTSWTYTPTANASGVDSAITHFRVRPKGIMAGNSSFSIQVRYRIR